MLDFSFNVKKSSERCIPCLDFNESEAVNVQSVDV